MDTLITTSWDDGHLLDLKLAELLCKHNIPATFYIPITYRGEYSTPVSRIRELAAVFDIGAHTYHHVKLTRVSEQEAEREINDGKKKLEEIVNKEVRAFCYPGGFSNTKIAAMVKEAGFLGARTTALLTRHIKNPFVMGTTAYTARLWPTYLVRHSLFTLDLEFFYFMLKNNLFLQPWHRIAMKTLEFVVSNGGIWHMWGHSWELDANNDWENLESVLREISQLPESIKRVDNSQLLTLYFT